MSQYPVIETRSHRVLRNVLKNICVIFFKPLDSLYVSRAIFHFLVSMTTFAATIDESALLWFNKPPCREWPRPRGPRTPIVRIGKKLILSVQTSPQSRELNGSCNTPRSLSRRRLDCRIAASNGRRLDGASFRNS